MHGRSSGVATLPCPRAAAYLAACFTCHQAIAMTPSLNFANPAGQAAVSSADYVAAQLALLGDHDPFEVQAATPDALRRAVTGLSEARLRQPEGPGRWSVMAVVAHLADSEMAYGFRLRMIVAHDRPNLQGYDQDRWAQRLRYNDADLEAELERFAVQRQASLRFYRALKEEEWARVGLHSERGEESVRHIFRLLAGHDLLHLRQIERIKAALGNEQVSMRN